jgi:hypothetical protein
MRRRRRVRLEADRDADASVAARPLPDGKAHTILVVEDNAITRKMPQVALQTAGYGVVEAAERG